jgi:pimeloyl-ACP methyl ester carboxylesterase
VTTFALVPGAWHGAWCFDALVAELERRGHRAVAVDLPVEDTSAGVSAYARVVVEALADAPDDVVLAGHSLGGLTIPVVAALRPVRRLVFVCGLLPYPGRSFADRPESDPEVFVPGCAEGIARDELGRSYWADPDEAVRVLYGDCSREDALAAVEHLRPQAQAPSTEPCPLERWPEVESAYVLCTEDRIVSPAWSRWAARDRLGVEPIELPGSHSPFLSRPAELADALGA